MSFKKLNINYKNCSDREREILEKYWACNSEGEFSITISKLCESYEMKQNELFRLAKNKTEVIWNFGKCSCGMEIVYRVLKRTNLTACIKDRGAVEDIWTSSVSSHFLKCDTCRKSGKNRTTHASNPFDSDYNANDFPSKQDLSNDIIERKIKSLSPYEMKLLYEIYRIQDFSLIKNSNTIFPVKFGEHKTFVWRTLFKFIRMKLISASRENSYIKDLFFDSRIEEVLENVLGDTSPLINQIDLEMTLIKVAEESRIKYFTILEPETDITLKAGSK